MKAFGIYLIRHGLAGQFGDYENDAERPLTPAGQRKTAQVLQRLRQLDVDFEQIVTSPFARAAQTAEILHHHFGDAKLETWEELVPDAPFEPLYDRLKQLDRRKPLAIVGHEPGLSEAAAMLVFGSVAARLVLKKTGVIRLDGPPTGELIGNCELRWLLPAKVLVD
jgi:phosphohistidine phosphatase